MYCGTLPSLIAIFALIWLSIRFLLPLIFPFALGLCLALAAEPLVGNLCRKARLPRPLSAGIGVSLTFCGLTVLLVLLCALIVRELGMLSRVLPDLAGAARSGLGLVEHQLLNLTRYTPENIQPMLQKSVTDTFSDGTMLLNRAVQYVLGLAGNLLTHVPDSALTLGTGIISAFMISGKLPQLKEALVRLLSRRRLKPLLKTLSRLKTNIVSWLLAQVKLSGISGLLLLLGLVVLGIPYAPLWALGICLVDAFPVLGTGTVLLPWALVLYLQGDLARALGIVGLYVTISITRSVLEPRLIGQQLGLDPLVTLGALYAGYKLWGILGMVFAPLLAVTAIQLLPARNDKL